MMLAVVLSQSASAQTGDPLAPLPPPVTVHRQTQPALPPTPSYLIPEANRFDTYKQRLAYIARAGGVREATIAAVLPYLTVNQRVIQLDRGQPGNIGIPKPPRPLGPNAAATSTPT